MLVEIFLAVVVGEFFAGFDGAAGDDEDAPARTIGLAVWRAGVIDEAGFVFWDVTIYHRRFSGPKEIFTLIARHFFERRRATNILDDARAFRYRFVSEKSATCCGCAHAEFEAMRGESPFLHDYHLYLLFWMSNYVQDVFNPVFRGI